MEKADWEI